MPNQSQRTIDDVDRFLARQTRNTQLNNPQRTTRRRQRGRRPRTRRQRRSSRSINHMVNIKSRIDDAKKYFEDVKANRIDYKYPEYSRKLQALVSAVKSIYPRRSKEELEKLMHGKVPGYNDKRYEFRHNDANTAGKLYYTMRRYPQHNRAINEEQGMPQGFNVDSSPTLSRSRSRTRQRPGSRQRSRQRSRSVNSLITASPSE